MISAPTECSLMRYCHLVCIIARLRARFINNNYFFYAITTKRATRRKEVRILELQKIALGAKMMPQREQRSSFLRLLLAIFQNLLRILFLSPERDGSNLYKIIYLLDGLTQFAPTTMAGSQAHPYRWRVVIDKRVFWCYDMCTL